MSKHSTDFEPSENQLAVLKAWRASNYLCTITGAMLNADLDRTTWYFWCKQPGFLTWWLAEAGKWFAQQLPRVYAACLKDATTPAGDGTRTSARHAELLIRRFDEQYAPQSRQTIESKQAQTIALADERVGDILSKLAGEIAKKPEDAPSPADTEPKEAPPALIHA